MINKRHLHKQNTQSSYFSFACSVYTYIILAHPISLLFYLALSFIDIKCVMQCKHLKSNRHQITAKLQLARQHQQRQKQQQKQKTMTDKTMRSIQFNSKHCGIHVNVLKQIHATNPLQLTVTMSTEFRLQQLSGEYNRYQNGLFESCLDTYIF